MPRLFSVFPSGLGLLLLALASPGRAQEPAAAPVAPAVPAPPANSAAGEEDAQSWKFVARASASATYDDNIFIQRTNPQDDVIYRVAPSFGWGIGSFRGEFSPLSSTPHFLAQTGEEELPRKDFAFVGYTPEAVFFDRHHGEDDVNHDARIAARREEPLWNAEGELHFQSVADTNIDLGQRLRQTYYSASLGGEYALTGKINGGLRFDGVRSDYDAGFSSTDAHGKIYADYQIAPKTLVGFGIVVGYLDVAGGSNQDYQQPVLQLKYQATSKLSFTGQAGEEFRQFASGIRDRSQFAFLLNGNFEPADGTTLTVSGRRDTQSSAQYAGENIVQTVYQGGVRQRFWQRVYLSLTGGFARENYENNRVVAVVARRDDYSFYKAALSGDITRRGTLELSYEYRKNDSSLANFSFNENLASLGVSFLF